MAMHLTVPLDQPMTEERDHSAHILQEQSMTVEIVVSLESHSDAILCMFAQMNYYDR